MQGSQIIPNMERNQKFQFENKSLEMKGKNEWNRQKEKQTEENTICIALQSIGWVLLCAAAAYLYRLAQFNDRNRKDLFKSFTF